MPPEPEAPAGALEPADVEAREESEPSAADVRAPVELDASPADAGGEGAPRGEPSPDAGIAEAVEHRTPSILAGAARLEPEEEGAAGREPAVLAETPTVAFGRQAPLPSAAPELQPPLALPVREEETRSAGTRPAVTSPALPDTLSGAGLPPPASTPLRFEPKPHGPAGSIPMPGPRGPQPFQLPGAPRLPTASPPLARAEGPSSRGGLRLALSVAAAAVGALVGLTLVLAVLYRWIDPPASTLMLGQWVTGTRISQQWVPIERMSPNLLAAVILSEDGQFCRHRGVDWGELKEVVETVGEGTARGGSTITMQVVKNLFLWPSRSYVRKALEIPLALTVEMLWPKRRTLEIYLNIAEWGPGVFGAEAAARYHFKKSAVALSPREATLLAVSLPNPIERRAGRPGHGTQRLADNLLLRMRTGASHLACLRKQP